MDPEMPTPICVDVDPSLSVDAVSFKVSYRGRSFNFTLSSDTTLAALYLELERTTGALASSQRLLMPRKSGQSLLDANSTLKSAGIREGQTLRLVGASKAEIEAASVPLGPDRVLGFEEEARRAESRKAAKPSSYVQLLPKGLYTFGSFQTLELPGAKLHPPAARALRIMHKLASDPGIVAVMAKHKWRVGVMTEMPPVGYVGISPKCILGFNKNRGEEISLRLRTDDLEGFRKYISIRKTLLHELAHMVHDEHDSDFKSLDSQLNREATALDWSRSTANTLSGSAPQRHGWGDSSGSEDEGEDRRRPMSHRLGGAASQLIADPHLAALEAAERRRLETAAAVGERGIPHRPDGQVPGDAEAVDEPVEAGRHYAGSSLDEAMGDTSAPAKGNVHDMLYSPPKGAGAGAGAEVNREGRHSHGQAAASDAEVADWQNLDRVEAAQPGKERMPGGAAEETQQTLGEVPAANWLTAGTSTAAVDSRVEATPMHMGLQVTQAEVAANAPDGGHVVDEDEDVEVARMRAAADEVAGRIRAAVVRLKEEAAPQEASLALKTITTILRNALAHPGETKFARLRKANPKFFQALGRFPAAVDVLLAAGFVEVADSGLGQGDREVYLHLRRNDPGLLWLACSMAESCYA